jgi:transcriptional regulator
VPKAHRLEDLDFLHEFMEEFSFAELITSSPTLQITHIPVILDRSAGAYGKICGHVSRQNPQCQAFMEGQTAVIVFRGPHAYISPAWFDKTPSVPTWNYAVVHASGQLRAIAEKAELRSVLEKSIEKHEGHQCSSYALSDLPENYLSAMMGGIVGFEMPIESLEGKFKLGQDQNDADRQRLLEHLRQQRQERPLCEFSENFYNRFT